MKNNKSKSASIMLIIILNTMLIIFSMMYAINEKYNDVQIAKKEEQTKQIDVTESKEIAEQNTEITSRSTTESREDMLKTEQTTESDTEINEEIANEQQDIIETQNIIEVEAEIEYIKIEDVKISKDMDLTKTTGLSREDFITLIAEVKADTSGFFEENAGTIYDLCQTYEINEIFFCGLISAESGWNIASNHRRTYNYISMMSGGKLIQFSSVEEGLEKAAELLHNKYLTPGGKFYHGSTLNGVKTCFCPSGTWVSLVYGRMQQIV